MDLPGKMIISDGWISVKDRLPTEKDYENDSRFLTYGIPTCNGSCERIYQVRECRWRRTYKCFEFGEYDCSIDVTHWMPLPDPPKQ